MSFVFQDLNIIQNDAGRYDKPHPFKRETFPTARILVWASYWIDYQTFGPSNPDGWRSTNRLMHLFNATLVMLLSTPIAGILFLVHPLTTMGWSYVAGRSGVMSAMFQLAIILLVLTGWTSIAWLLACIAIVFLKEDSVMFLPMIVALWVTK